MEYQSEQLAAESSTRSCIREDISSINSRDEFLMATIQKTEHWYIEMSAGNALCLEASIVRLSMPEVKTNQWEESILEEVG